MSLLVWVLALIQRIVWVSEHTQFVVLFVHATHPSTSCCQEPRFYVCQKRRVSVCQEPRLCVCHQMRLNPQRPFGPQWTIWTRMDCGPEWTMWTPMYNGHHWTPIDTIFFSPQTHHHTAVRAQTKQCKQPHASPAKRKSCSTLWEVCCHLPGEERAPTRHACCTRSQQVVLTWPWLEETRKSSFPRTTFPTAKTTSFARPRRPSSSSAATHQSAALE